VLIAESYPPQVIVHIKGGLADSCTTFHKLNTKRSDNTVNIEVTTQRPREAVCAQVYGFFEKNVSLGSDFIAGETYTININDKTTSFMMPKAAYRWMTLADDLSRLVEIITPDFTGLFAV